MRIGVNCFLLGPSIGGLKQYFQTLFRELLATDTANEYVFFHFFDWNVAELEAMGAPRWRTGAVRLQDQLEVKRQLGSLDLYFCPFGCLWPAPLPIPSVVTLVDLQEKYYPEFFTPADHWNRDFFFYGSARQADAVITISSFSKDSIVRFHGVAPDKIHVVPLCGDPRYADAERVARAPGPALPESFVFYPANHWRHKNHRCLLKAARLLREEHGLRLPLVLTGFQQPNGFALRDALAEEGLAADATLLEFVSVEEMAFLYRRARLLCFPSLFEGFGLPLAEAMAAGCPIACSNASSVPEVVGDAALLFDPNDARDCARLVLQLWQDDELRARLVERGRERAARFSAARVAEGHLQAFRAARERFSYVGYLRNRLLFDPWHRLRLMRRRPPSGS